VAEGVRHIEPSAARGREEGPDPARRLPSGWGSGLPMPRRRTFAPGILPCAHSDADCAPQSLLRLSAYAGLRGMGSPSRIEPYDMTGGKCFRQQFLEVANHRSSIPHEMGVSAKPPRDGQAA
jgi:hypothetical protein